MKVEVGKTYETRMPGVYHNVTIIRDEKNGDRFPMYGSDGHWYSKRGAIAGNNRSADLFREAPINTPPAPQ